MKLNDMTDKEINIYSNLKRQIDATFRHSNECAFKTRERYKDAMYSFAKFLTTEYRKQNIIKIKNSHIENYVLHMQKNGYSTSYVTTNLSAIRYYYDKATDGHFIIKNNKELGVNARTKNERIGKNRSINDQQYNELLIKAKEIGRDDFVYEICVSKQFGLRIHEVFGLRHSQLNRAIKSNYLEIKGKGGLIRSYPLYEKDKEFLTRLNAYKDSGTDRIFVGKDEKTHIKIKEMQKFIEKSRKSEDDYTFHSLRHRYAQKLYKELIENGISEYEARILISKRLGHNRKGISEIYLDTIES